MLLVLDNVDRHVLPAILPFLTMEHCQGSLLLATAWHADAFQQLTHAQVSGCHPIISTFSVLPMAGELLLQPADARQLLMDGIQGSRLAAGQPGLSKDELTDLAAKAAEQLAFKSEPAYVPRVLHICALALGRTSAADAPGVLSQIQQQLQGSKLSGTAPGLTQSEIDATFASLEACFRQLTDLAQQVLLDVEIASQHQAHFEDLDALAKSLGDQQSRTGALLKAQVCGTPPQLWSCLCTTSGRC